MNLPTELAVTDLAECRELVQLAASSKQFRWLLTAKVQGPDQRRFAEMGVAAILFKPFDPLTLAKQISAALGWKEGG